MINLKIDPEFQSQIPPLTDDEYKQLEENILKEGDWNTMRIKVQGDNVQTWLNGQEMVNINDEKIGAGQGRIALQIHDGGGIKVLWRNLKVKTL